MPPPDLADREASLVGTPTYNPWFPSFLPCHPSSSSSSFQLLLFSPSHLSEGGGLSRAQALSVCSPVRGAAWPTLLTSSCGEG